MSEVEQSKCTCWQLRTEDGGLTTSASACMHDEIRVVLRDGTVAQGWSYGPTWWGPRTSPMDLMEIETGDAGSLVVAYEEIVTIQPIGAYTTQEDLLEGVADAVNAARAADEDCVLRLVLDAHEAVDVQVRLHSHGCAPPARPPWADWEDQNA